MIYYKTIDRKISLLIKFNNKIIPDAKQYNYIILIEILIFMDYYYILFEWYYINPIANDLFLEPLWIRFLSSVITKSAHWISRQFILRILYRKSQGIYNIDFMFIGDRYAFNYVHIIMYIVLQHVVGSSLASLNSIHYLHIIANPRSQL